MKKLLRLILVLAAFIIAASQGRPFTATDMNKIPRVGSPSVSPDNKHFVTTVNVWDQEKNKKTQNLLLGELSATGLSNTRTLCKKQFVSDSNPLWIDDNTILFLSNRNGNNNFWVADITNPDADPVMLTEFPVDVETAELSSSKDRVVFSASVYPGKTFAETAALDAEIASSRSHSQKWTKTFVRRWDSWYEGKYSHVFTAELTFSQAKWTISSDKVVDLMGEMEGDCPSRPFGDSSEYAVSPNGDSFAFTTQLGDDKAWSTDLNVYVVDKVGGAAECITCDNNATDTTPAYSPDGKYIAYVAMAIPGYESDYKHIRIYDREAKTTRKLADDWDVSVSSVSWSADGAYLYAVVTEDALTKVYKVNVQDGIPSEFAGEHTSSGFNIIPCVDDSKKECAVYTMTSFSDPAEVYMTTANGAIPVRLTTETKAVLSGVEFTETINFHYKGADDDEIQAWIQTPYGFNSSLKYPVVVMIHGGPESAWQDSFHYRWNAQLFAAQGFVLFAPNPHGSISFGANFTKAILREWGGKPYQDIMMGLDAMGAEYEWADITNAGAIGASFGGYMINWINSQTDRFKCLVCHDGIFDTIANYWQTDELYFPYIEFGGLPTDEGNVYEKWSPSTYANKMNTPELIIHGGLDYRIPDVVGLSVFNNLQRRGVDSVFIRFPNENHYVTNPNNSIYWYGKVNEWLKKYLVDDENRK